MTAWKLVEGGNGGQSPEHIVNASEGLINQFLSAVEGGGGESLQNDVKRQNGEN